MIIVAVALFIECGLCHILLQPNELTPVDEIQWIMLFINFIIACFAIERSIMKSPNLPFRPGNIIDMHPEKEQVKNLLLISFIIRIFILVWDVYARNIFILPNSEGDAWAYHLQALSFAWGGRRNLIDFSHFPFYYGQLYKLVGPQKLTAQFINVYLAMCSLVMVYKILCKLNITPQVRKTTMMIAAFLPNLMMITTFFLQESMISFWIISSVYFYINWWQNGNIWNLVFTVLCSLAGALLHMGALVTGMGTLMMLVIVGNKERIVKFTPFKIIMVVAMGFLLVILLSTFGGDLLDKVGGEVSAESIVYGQTVREDGGGAYVIGIQGLPPAVDVVVNTPVRMIYFIFSPLPWMWRGPGDILAFFGSTIFYFYTFYVAVKAYRSHPIMGLQGSNIGSFLVVLTVIMALAAIMFGWGVSNSGSALRHREKFTYVCLIICAISNEILLRTGNTSENRRVKKSFGRRPGF